MTDSRFISLFDSFLYDRIPSGLGVETDISHTDDKAIVKMDLPGLDKEAIKIEIKDGKLVVSGERAREKLNYSLEERCSGKFTRSFIVGKDFDADNISATMKNGVLTLEVPKIVNKKSSKTIEIS